MGPNVWFDIWDRKWVLEWGFPVRKRFFDTEEEARAAVHEVFAEHIESIEAWRSLCGVFAEIGGRHLV